MIERKIRNKHGDLITVDCAGRELLAIPLFLRRNQGQARYEMKKEITEKIGLNKNKIWCHPLDDNNQRWVLMFEDADLGINTYYDHKEAVDAFNRAEAMGWNCHLLTSVGHAET